MPLAAVALLIDADLKKQLDDLTIQYRRGDKDEFISDSTSEQA